MNKRTTYKYVITKTLGFAIIFMFAVNFTVTDTQ